MHAKLIVCAVSASLAAAAPHRRRSSTPFEDGMSTEQNWDARPQTIDEIGPIENVAQGVAAPEEFSGFTGAGNEAIPSINNDVTGQTMSTDDFINSLLQFAPQIIDFFSNPQNLAGLNPPPPADVQDPNVVAAGVGVEDGGVQPPAVEDVAPPADAAAVAAEQVQPPPDAAAVAAEQVQPPPDAAAVAAEQVQPPPAPPQEEQEDDKKDEEKDNGPSDIAKIGNLAGDIISGNDGTGDLIGAGIDLIGGLGGLFG